jgi:hypothetical protein
MDILQEMWDIVMSVFTTDSISLIIMLLVVVAAGMILGELGRIVQVTVGALAIYGLLRLAYSLSQGAEPGSLPSTAWSGLKIMTVGELVVYFIAFAIVISIVHVIRNAVAAGGGGGGGHH